MSTNPDKTDAYTHEEIREKWHETANTLHEIKTTQEVAAHHFQDHQIEDTKRFGFIDDQLNVVKRQNEDLKTQLDKLTKVLEPVSKTYDTVVTLGTWSKVGLGFLLLGLSVFLAVKSLFGK